MRSLKRQGGWIAAAIQAAAGRRDNYEREKESSRVRRFQKNMSDSAHQREVADMRAAGLNPILSATRGASVPGGAMANFQSTLGDAMSTALQEKKLKQELKNLKAVERKDTMLANQAAADAFLKHELYLNEGKKGRAMDAEISRMQADQKLYDDPEFGKFLRLYERVMGTTGASKVFDLFGKGSK